MGDIRRAPNMGVAEFAKLNYTMVRRLEGVEACHSLLPQGTLGSPSPLIGFHVPSSFFDGLKVEANQNLFVLITLQKKQYHAKGVKLQMESYIPAIGLSLLFNRSLIVSEGRWEGKRCSWPLFLHISCHCCF